MFGAFAALGVCSPLATGQGFCGTPDMDSGLQEEAQQQMDSAAISAFAEAENITVPTYFHVVAKDKTVAGGYLSVSKSHSLCMGVFRLTDSLSVKPCLPSSISLTPTTSALVSALISSILIGLSIRLGILTTKTSR